MKTVSKDVPEIERWLGQQKPVPMRWPAGRVMTASCRNTVRSLIKTECPEKNPPAKANQLSRYGSHTPRNGKLTVGV